MKLLLQCTSSDVELEVTWKPRSNKHQQVADYWSKVVYPSDYMLNPEVYQQLIEDPLLERRKPILDAFASSSNTKVPEALYSRFYCHGSKGGDAMVYPWAEPNALGLDGLVYIYGLFHLMGAIIKKIKDEQVNCVLVGPNWPSAWRATLRNMPIKKIVVLPHIDNLCLPGPRLPRKKATPKHPAYQKLAWYILW